MPSRASPARTKSRTWARPKHDATHGENCRANASSHVLAIEFGHGWNQLPPLHRFGLSPPTSMGAIVENRCPHYITGVDAVNDAVFRGSLMAGKPHSHSGLENTGGRSSRRAAFCSWLGRRLALPETATLQFSCSLFALLEIDLGGPASVIRLVAKYFVSKYLGTLGSPPSLANIHTNPSSDHHHVRYRPVFGVACQPFRG
jgi:hypothetical protein